MARIVVVAAAWLPERVDGAILVARHLARAYAGRGHEVTVLCRHLGSPSPVPVLDAAAPRVSESVDEGLRVLRLELPRERRFGGGLGDDVSERAVADALGALRPDVVHVHHLENLSPRLPRLAADLGAACVLTLHDFHPVCASSHLIARDGSACPGPDGGRRCARCWPASARARPTRGWAGRAGRLLDVATGRHRSAFRSRFRAGQEVLAGPGVLVSPSRYLAARLRELAPGATPITVIPNGADERPAAAAAARTGPPVVGFTGNLLRAKGLHVLTQALARLHDLPWTLAVHGGGDPRYVDACRAALPAGRALFAGAYDPAGAGAILHGIDVLAMPSLCLENCPLVLTQALAAGVPCVVSGRAGMAELVRDGVDGVHVPPGDPAALAAALRPLLADPARRRILAEAAAARPPRPWSAVADDYLALLRGRGAPV